MRHGFSWVRAGLLALGLLAVAGPSQAVQVSNILSVTNTTDSAQDFFFLASAPADEFVSRFIASSITVSVIDTDGDGFAELSNVGVDPIYAGMVNGATVLTLLDNATLLSCNVAGCTDTAAMGPVAGAFTPVDATEIAIAIGFTLSPGDSASVLSRFEVVPEPATALLLVGGLAAMAARCRTR